MKASNIALGFFGILAPWLNCQPSFADLHRELVTSASYDRAGTSGITIEDIVDVNGNPGTDGFTEFVITEPFWPASSDPNDNSRGKIRVINGNPASEALGAGEVRSLEGAAPFVYLGAKVTNHSNMGGSSAKDFAVAIPGNPSVSGTVQILDPNNLSSPICTLHAANPLPGDQFGSEMLFLGTVNGQANLLAIASPPMGRVEIFRGCESSPIATLGPFTGTFGLSMHFADVIGSNTPELIVGSPFYDTSADRTTDSQGRVQLFDVSNLPSSPTQLTAYEIRGTEPSAFLGSSLASAGNLPGTPTPKGELAVGAIGANYNSGSGPVIPDTGIVRIFTFNPNSGRAEQFGIIDRAREGGQLGVGLTNYGATTGEVILAASAPNGMNGSEANRGEMMTIIPRTPTSEDPRWYRYQQFLPGSGSGSAAGFALTRLADATGDGVADLLMPYNGLIDGVPRGTVDILTARSVSTTEAAYQQMVGSRPPCDGQNEAMTQISGSVPTGGTVMQFNGSGFTPSTSSRVYHVLVTIGNEIEDVDGDGLFPNCVYVRSATPNDPGKFQYLVDVDQSTEGRFTLDTRTALNLNGLVHTIRAPRNKPEFYGLPFYAQAELWSYTDLNGPGDEDNVTVEVDHASAAKTGELMLVIGP